MIAGMLGLGEDQVRAIAPEVGGGFGAKINIYPEEYVCAAVSRRLGVPVKWIEERSEAFVATTHGRDILCYIDVAAKRDGKVLGIKMRLIADIGAYNMLLTAAIPTLTMLMANATYDIPAIRTTLTEVFTNKTPTDAYRGAGRPEATFFVERAMDMLARELKMDPAEVRRKNFIPKNKFPYQTQMGAVYDSGDYEAALDAALKAADWKNLLKERDDLRKQGRLAGVGLAMYVEVCGIGPSATLPTGGWEHAQVTIERDGRISASTGVSPHGQGNETTFGQMLADQFGVPIEHVTIHHGDTDVVKQGIGTQSVERHSTWRATRCARRWRSLPVRCSKRLPRTSCSRAAGSWSRARRPRRNRSARLRRSPISRFHCPKGWSLASAPTRISSRPTTPTRSAATSSCWKSIERPASRNCDAWSR
jgi:carbon-monoxide dehydrogenase large subunit